MLLLLLLLLLAAAVAAVAADGDAAVAAVAAAVAAVAAVVAAAGAAVAAVASYDRHFFLTDRHPHQTEHQPDYLFGVFGHTLHPDSSYEQAWKKSAVPQYVNSHCHSHQHIAQCHRLGCH